MITPPGWTPPPGMSSAPYSSPTLPPSISTPSGKPSGCVGCGGGKSPSSINFSNSNSLQSSMNSPVQSWYDVALQQPVDPRILIANSYLDATQGAFTRSATYGAAGWAATPLTLNGSVTCATLHTDDMLAVAEAAQWTFSHQGQNLAGTNPPCLQKVQFLRGGTSYEMSFGIDFGGSNHTNVQLSFRDNVATPGDFAGTFGSIPVISYTGTWTGVRTFKVTLKQLGTFIMGLRTQVGGSNYLFEMEWNVVQ